MQIGNFLQYDNVDALGNVLTYSEPCKFNAKFKGSNCFYSNTTANYITLGNKADFSDVVAVEFSAIFYSITAVCTLFSNIINNVSQFWRATNSSRFIVDTPYSNISYSFVCPFDITNGEKVDIKLSVENDVPYLWVNGTSIDRTQATHSGTWDDIAYIGTRKKNGSISSGSTLRDTSIWNFRCYNANGDLVHHYPMSEGMGKIIYDTVGDKHGIIVNAGNLYSVVWSKTQDYYHYNLTNGYISIDGDDCNRFTNTLKIPLKDPENVLLYKDNYNSDIANITRYNGTPSAYTYTIKSDTDGSKYINFAVNEGSVSQTYNMMFSYTFCTDFNGQRYNSSISSPNLSSNLNYWRNVNPNKETTYTLKIKVRCNSHSINEVTKSAIYSINLLAMYPAPQFPNQRIYNLPTDGEWHEYSWTAATGTSTSTYSTNLATSVNALLIQIYHSSNLSTTDTFSLDIDFKDIEFYRNSNNTYHPPILNGHNGAETLLDFTQQGSTNVAEIQKPILANYRCGLIQSTDRSMGANGSMRANGWEGAMAAASQTARTTITNGVWAVIYNPVSVGNTTCGYIDNYELTAEELSMMGLSSTGVKANAVQFTSGTNSIIGSAIQNCGLYYRIQYSTLLGYNSSNVLINKSIYNQQYNVHFTGWMKRLTEYPVTNCYLGLTYCYITAIDHTGFTDIVNADNNWHYVDIMLPLNTCVHQTGTNNKTFGITCSPTGYTSYINPDTGVAYTAAEATHRPCLALADVKIVIEPAEVYNKDGTNFKLYNLNINQWSEPQYKRIENQTNFKL